MADENRLVQMILDGVASTATLKDKINANSARIEELKILTQDQPVVPPILHPSMALHYRYEVGKLMELLHTPDTKAEAIMRLRTLVEKIALTPIPGTNELSIDRSTWGFGRNTERGRKQSLVVTTTRNNSRSN